LIAGLAPADAIICPGLARWADDRTIVASTRENELGAGGVIKLYLVNRSPGGDVIPFGSKCECRGSNILQRHGAAVHQVVSVGEAVIEEQLVQVLAMHSCRHSRRIGKPRVEVGGDTGFAKQVSLDELREDHLVGAKDALPHLHVIQ